MIGFQTYVMDALQEAIEEAGLTPVNAASYANVGVLHAMRGFDAVVSIHYDFQPDRASISLDSAALFGPATPDRFHLRPGDGAEARRLLARVKERCHA